MTSSRSPAGQHRVNDATTTALQRTAVLILVALSALDGYDMLSVAFAAPVIARTWSVGSGATGILLSTGLAGMAFGSFFLAPIADLRGRRPVLLASLAAMASGMLWSALAASILELAASRVLTGLGIGTCIAVLGPLATEFSHPSRRALANALAAMGFPVGGAIGGVVSAGLLRSSGWPAIFFLGAGATLVMIPVVLRFLPESPAFLLGLRSPAQPNEDAAAASSSRPPSVTPPRQGRVRRGYDAIFAAEMRADTLRFAAAWVLFSVTASYVFSWLPQMVVDAGFSASRGGFVGAVAQAAGLVGGLMLGFLTSVWRLRPLTVGALIGLGIATAALGYGQPSIALLTAVGGLSGFFLFAAAAGFSATLAMTFKAEARASGVGFVLGAGRIGAALAPLIAGFLLAGTLGRGVVAVIFGACAVVAGGLVASLQTLPCDGD